MANVKTTLTITGGSGTNSFSNSRQYTEETVNKFYVDASDGFTDLIAFSPDDESPTKTCTATGAPKAFCIYNSGTTGVEIQIQNIAWTHGEPDTNGSDVFNSMILGAGEMFFSNNMRLIQASTGNSSAMGASTSLALASGKVSSALTSTVARGGAAVVISGADSASATAIVVDDGASRLREGDYLYVVNSGTDDVMRVVSVESDTEFTAERGVLGYTAQSLDDDAVVYMYAGNQLHNKGTEDDSGVNIRTDAQGRFKGMLLGDNGDEPRGTGQTQVAGGIVPGSVSIQFPLHGGYQNLGVSVSLTDSTGLATGTTYGFRITDSLGTTSDIEFTTDTSDVSWGKVIQLINTAFISANLDYHCSIVNGDVRFSAKKWLDGDSITLANPTDATNVFGVGSFGAVGTHESPVKTQFPRGKITDVQSGKKILNTAKMLIDDGNGNLISEDGTGSGSIDYDSGIIDITGPYRAEFKTSFAYGSAHSGIPTRAANIENMVSVVAGRSMNPRKNGEITIICYS